MAPEDLIKATEGIIKGKKHGEQADRLIKSYQRLRRFFPEEKRADLAEGFVSFCQGRIGEKRFRQLAEILGGARKKQRKNLSAAGTRTFFLQDTSAKVGIDVLIKTT